MRLKTRYLVLELAWATGLNKDFINLKIQQNMKNYLMLIFLSLFFFANVNCTKENPDSGIPECVQEKIKQLENEGVRNPPASIWQYDYKGQTVYYVPPYCCDFYGLLYESNCNLICAPDGGLTGKGDGKCKDFFTESKNGKLIWQDSRK